MSDFEGRVAEIQLEPSGGYTAWIQCPPGAVPTPGRYLAAWSPEDLDAPLAVPLFPQQQGEAGFLAAPPIPPALQPGSELRLRGPLGTGFDLRNFLGPSGLSSPAARRLALAALGDTVARLLPLLAPALEQGAAVALFTDCPLPVIPPEVEVYPLVDLPDGLGWADYFALDLPRSRLPELRSLLRLPHEAPLPCPAQALVLSPMPCMGMGECGVCAVPSRRFSKLACVHGPVFDLRALDW